MNIPEYLFCENPVYDENNDRREFIVYTGDPFILAEIYPFENIGEKDILEKMRQMPTGARLDYNGIETFFFVPVKMIESKEFAKLSDQKQSDRIASIMRKMADWYEYYLDWEDNQ